MTGIVSAFLLALIVQVNSLGSQVNAHPTAAGLRQLAYQELEAGLYRQASAHFEAAAKRYEALGDLNAAKVLRDQSLRYSTSIQLYVEAPYVPDPSAHLARLEPPYGCIHEGLGVF